jgi:MFS family permease
MTSLTDVYEREVGGVASRQRLYLGLALFAVGTAMVVGSIVVATTSLAETFGLGVYEARELAGVLAGLGIPGAFLGSFTLLPARRRTRAAAVIGASLAVFGVTLFREAYPGNWIEATGAADHTLPVVTVYLLGAITVFWCLFVAVANFKTRNDPGGTVKMEVTEEGTTRILEVSGSVPGLGSTGSMPSLGSVATFGDGPDGGIGSDGDDGEVLYSRDGPAGSAAASDGGSATQTASGATDADAADSEVVEAVQTRRQPDPYCGNCEHFQYVRVDGELEPYCGLDADLMDDMEACDNWSANN